MKPTAFKALVESIKIKQREINCNNNYADQTDYSLLTTQKQELKELRKPLESLVIVSVSHSAGQRTWYEEAYKVGKGLYLTRNLQKLKRSNYPEIVDVITEEMKTEMMEDSYYY